MAIKKLLFVDTNIWLDFYRYADAGLTLLTHLERVSDRLIVTYQLEMEYKKNRQAAILQGIKGLKQPETIPRPGIFSDAKAAKVLQTSIKSARDRVKALQSRMKRAIENPASYDPVYMACQRIFHAKSELRLTRENKFSHIIRHRAFRRFIEGCPPRKKGDTSFGDSFNWEWMIECALRNTAELVIVSRDTDYGIDFGKAYINDYLRQEFSERVSQKRKILLYTKISEALKHFDIRVTAQEEKEEEQIIKTSVREMVAVDDTGHVAITDSGHGID